jgi:hypothetical protein
MFSPLRRPSVQIPRLVGFVSALTLIAACQWPGSAPALDGDLTVGSLLLGSGNARLVTLRPGDEATVTLNGQRAGLMAVASQHVASERATVELGDARGLKAAAKRTLKGLEAGTAPVGPPDFHARLRAWEAPLREASLANPPTYHLAEAPRYHVGDEEDFWVIADLAEGQSTEIQVPARAAYVGEHCYVFLDQQVPSGELEARVDVIGRTFDEQIFPTDARIFGQPLAQGVNGDPRITLLVSPVVGNYGKDTTIGYFTLRDLYAPGADPTNPVLKRSNQRLMLYVSPYVVARGQASDYLGTIAHELQHLINASQKLFRARGQGRTEDLWLDEGLAMYAMEANGYGLAGEGGVVFNHVAGYLADPGAYSLTDWRRNPSQSGYGAAYLFTTYLVERFGEAMLGELVASPQVGTTNLNARLGSRGTSLKQVFDEWTLANLLDDTGLSADPKHQYQKLSLLGTYGARKLRGLRLESLTAPGRATVDLKPYSARYFLLPPGHEGAFGVGLAGAGSAFAGFLVIP